jgi:hypothetical protein
MKLPVFLFAILLAIGTLSSCKKDKYMSEGIITGYDVRKCACCGGLMINFDSEKEPYKGDYKLFTNSQDMGIDYNDNFPIPVKVDWKTINNQCGEHEMITVTRWKRK